MRKGGAYMKTLADIDLSAFDFLDFGSSQGDSMKFAKEYLGGKRGLGIDFDRKKIEKAQRQGYDCLLGDITALELPDKCVDFVVISHVLEHLHTFESVTKTIASAVRVARHFVYIQGPWYDADEYLAGLGLKFYWSDWKIHRFHLASHHLVQILDSLGVQRRTIAGRGDVADTSHFAIHPITSPPEQHHYRPEHGYKSIFPFSRPVFKEIVCIAAKPDYEGYPSLLGRLPGLASLDALSDEQHPTGTLYTQADIIHDLNHLTGMLTERYLQSKADSEDSYAKFKAKEQDAKDLHQRLAAKEQDAKELHLRLTAKEQDAKDLYQQLEEKRADNQRLYEMVQELRGQIDSIKAESQTKLDESRRAFKGKEEDARRIYAMLQEKREDNQRLYDLLQEARAALSAMGREHRAELEAVRKRYRTRQEAKEAEAARMYERLQQRREDARQLTAVIQMLHARLEPSEAGSQSN